MAVHNRGRSRRHLRPEAAEIATCSRAVSLATSEANLQLCSRSQRRMPRIQRRHFANNNGVHRCHYSLTVWLLQLLLDSFRNSWQVWSP